MGCLFDVMFPSPVIPNRAANAAVPPHQKGVEVSYLSGEKLGLPHAKLGVEVLL
jgi:hypothetical protein